MRFEVLLFRLIGRVSLNVAAPVQVGDLVKPPVDAPQFTIMSIAGRHGSLARWAASDGTRFGRESLLLRGQVFETDSRDGTLQHLLIRGFTPSGDAAETFDIQDGVAHWKSPVDAGTRRHSQPAMYSAFGGPMDLAASLVVALIAAPDQSPAMLPGGEVKAAQLATLVVGTGVS